MSNCLYFHSNHNNNSTSFSLNTHTLSLSSSQILELKHKTRPVNIGRTWVSGFALLM